METGVRDLKNNLSRYLRQVESGQRVSITAHGRVVAELVSPANSPRHRRPAWDELVASGVIQLPIESGDPFEDWPDIELPPGSARDLIDSDRGET